MENLPKVLQNIITEYVDGDIINPVIENNLDKINWNRLSDNENAIHILEKNLDKIKCTYLYTNIKATHIIDYFLLKKRKLKETDFINLCRNKNTVYIIEKFLSENEEYYKNNGENQDDFDKIDWSSLCENPNFV